MKHSIMLSICLLFISSNLAAHGGRTNSEGCHNNRKTGDYHCHRGNKPTANPTKPLSSSNKQSIKPSNCGSKYYCTEMSSCEEAQYYYQNCGLSKLDGDNDGIPCENVCQ